MVVHIAYICCETCWESDPLNVRIFWMLWFNMTHLNATKELQFAESWKKTRGISRLLGGMMMLRLSPAPHQHHNHWFQKLNGKKNSKTNREHVHLVCGFNPFFGFLPLSKRENGLQLWLVATDGWGVFSPRLRCFKLWLPSWWRSWLPVHWCGLPALWSRADVGVELNGWNQGWCFESMV